MKILCFYPAMQAADLAALRHAAPDHELVAAANAEEAVAAAPGCQAVLGFMPAAVFEACDDVRWFQSASAGVDSVLFPALVESAVTVTNMAGLYARAGAEQAWALWLALARGVQASMARFPRREWAPGPVRLVSDSTALVLGMGGFGQEIAKRAAGYDLRILALDPVRQAYAGVQAIRPPNRRNLHDLLPQADAVLCACPLTEETYHLIGAAELARMKSTAYLINVSRGGIVDEDALCAALHADAIAGAGLDVAETEPLPAESPLWDAPRLILTPHRAGFSQDRHRNVVQFFAANLKRFVSGRPLRNVVDKRLGY